MTVVKLLPAGLPRALNGKVGMTFIVDCFTNGGKVAHDYRYDNTERPYQIWSISADGYEIIEQPKETL